MANTWVFTGQDVPAQLITDTSTTQKAPLGTRKRAYHATYGEGEFIYMSGVASTVVGSAVQLNYDDGTTVLQTSSIKGPVGFAMSINVASQYGWYQVYGKAVGKVLAAFADNADVYATATAGSLDDAVVDGYLVHNCRGASAIDTPSTGLAELEIAYPYVDAIATND